MLFNSVDFILFFAVVVTQYFRAPLLIRLALVGAGLVFPVLRYGMGTEPVAATFFSAISLTAVAWIRRGNAGQRAVSTPNAEFAAVDGDDCAGGMNSAEYNEHRARRLLLITASLLFYGVWRWQFTSLMIFSTVLDFSCGLGIHHSRSVLQRRLLLTVSMIGNLGLLAFFKYANFFLENVQEAGRVLGWHDHHLGPLGIVLPLGISFYTFQTMSYTIDVYRKELRPARTLLDFMLFVTFFPQLVAGPIVRAAEFMPQLLTLKAWDSTRARSGLLLMLWGLLKKLLVADVLSRIADQAYANPEAFSGKALLVATYAFAFQIYCDFSGYSDVAIGAARVLGFHIPQNFRRPYFATNIATFWHRWHISLSTWLRDYLYVPLGGSRCPRPRVLANLMITMVLGGLWHGASWNFIIWGLIHGTMLCLHRIWMWTGGHGKASDAMPLWKWVPLSAINFHVVCVTWVFFRARTLDQSLNVLGRVFTGAEGLMVPWLLPAILIPALILIQLVQTRVSIIDQLVRHPRLSRLLIYLGLALVLAIVTTSRPADFIYFVF